MRDTAPFWKQFADLTITSGIYRTILETPALPSSAARSARAPDRAHLSPAHVTHT
jgi:hypothetical protein